MFRYQVLYPSPGNDTIYFRLSHRNLMQHDSVHEIDLGDILGNAIHAPPRKLPCRAFSLWVKRRGKRRAALPVLQSRRSYCFLKR